MLPLAAYQQQTLSDGYTSLREADAALAKLAEEGVNVDDVNDEQAIAVLEAANQTLADKVREQTDDILAQVLFVRSLHMKNAFGASDH